MDKKILSGKDVSNATYQALRSRIEALKSQSIVPGLAVLLIGEDAGSQIYVRNKTKKEFPQNVFDQLFEAIGAVFLSWESNRAKVYRKLNQIPSDWGTAVNVQSMVFGNMGNDCATGVVFTDRKSVV